MHGSERWKRRAVRGPRRQMEWIDEIVFPYRFAAALISENAAPVNRPFPTFFAPAGRSWALVPRRDGQGSRREPKALPLAVVGAGDMVSQRQQAPVPFLSRTHHLVRGAFVCSPPT